ncbi:oxidoreductase [Lentzea sp. NBRC 105346]|uniref:ferredoxin reductase n=1 Tax=Lentzea sp. NBRC 105346 TaxID=3032205 RepID=UPI0024A1CC84|nr:ferredoxin reductase [Lentzea sp. NBRC 105346]GLZ35328.1 oxidoreductase [Lentzea sp. NBRC 105346]
MAGAAVSGRLTWRVAELAEARQQTHNARSLVFDVPGWPGHLPGQHVDVRLTAEDGYSVQRSYSIASTVDGNRVELSVQRVPGGEVSPYLCDVLEMGDAVELRGPVGGYFVWRPADPAPVLLVGGGSGIAPLMAMVRTRAALGSRVPFRLVYSVRTPEDVYFADELRRRVRDDAGLDVRLVYTRRAPAEATEPVGRVSVATLNTHGWLAEFAPNCFVCGSTGFVETVADILVALGHDPRRVRTERFGPSAPQRTQPDR